MMWIIVCIFNKLCEFADRGNARTSVLASAKVLMFVVAILDSLWPAGSEVFLQAKGFVTFLPLDLKFYTKGKVCVKLLDEAI